LSKQIAIRPLKGITGTRRWWADPFVWGFTALVVLSLIVTSLKTGEWLSGLLYVLAIALAGTLVLFITRKNPPAPLVIPHPGREYGAALGWYAAFMLLSVLIKGGGLLANEFGKWLWFIILPVFVLWLVQGRGRGFKALLSSVVPVRPGLGKALLLGLLAYVVMIPIIPFILPAEQLDKLGEIFNDPGKAALMVPLCLLLSLLTAALTEEIFFRGILQTRLAALIRSDLRACLITAFLFGIYHLPYAYFSTGWPPHGDFVWGLSSVLAEQMVGGALLGILWLRTRNIAAPVFFHALVNIAAIMTSLNSG
jgi:membrane protease YdiL (CAAX protease family)